jgi:hypothetical protein
MGFRTLLLLKYESHVDEQEQQVRGLPHSITNWYTTTKVQCRNFSCDRRAQCHAALVATKMCGADKNLIVPAARKDGITVGKITPSMLASRYCLLP